MANPNDTVAYQIKRGQFTGQTYDLTLDHNLLTHHCIEVFQGSNSVGARANEANESGVRVSGSPTGNLTHTTAANVIRLERGDSSPAADVELTVLVHECNDPTHADGFRLRGEFEFSMAAASKTASAAHSGVVDDGQCQVISGGTECDSVNTFKRNSREVRLRHTAANVEAERQRSDDASITTAFLIEWNSNTTVELVEFSEATMTAGGNLDAPAKWDTVAITAVDPTQAYLTGTFSSATSSSPSKGPETLAMVLGDGVTLPTSSTSLVAVGSQEGTANVEGWIYVVSNPNWYVTRSRFAHGVLVGDGVTSASFATAPPAGTETYTDVTAMRTCKGSRAMRFWQSVDSEFTSEFRLGQRSVIQTTGILANYYRQIADKSDPFGDGVAIVEIVDYDGNPFGDPDDIDGSQSSGSLPNNHSLVADGVVSSTLTVTVRDSAGAVVQSVGVTAQVGSQEILSGTTNGSGVVTFELTSNDVGTQAVTVLMGDDDVALSPIPLITFVDIPRNWSDDNRVGLNLGVIQDWSACDPFVDLFLAARGAEMIPRSGGSHDQAKEDFDSDGYQMTCGLTDTCRHYIATNDAKQRGSGRYILTYAGATWAGFDATQVDILGATIISRTIGEIEVEWDGSTLFAVDTEPSTAVMDATNYIHSFQLIPKSYHGIYSREKTLWRPEFLASLSGVQKLRFMDWLQTNNSYVINWSDRPTPTTSNCGRWIYDTDFPTVKRHIGVPLEWCIQLANLVNADPFFNFPHRAVLDYATQAATLVKAELNVDLVCDWEYTNEAWNPLFRQNAYREDLRIAYGLPDTNDDRIRAYATRACELFAAVDAVFGTSLQRRRRNICGQSANPAMATTIATADVSVGTSLVGLAKEHMDGYGCAPYVGNNVNEAVAADALAEMITDMEDSVMTAVTGELAQTVANIAAQSSTIKVFGYEGGQHVTQGAYLAMNQLPGMRGFMQDYMDIFDARTGNGTCYLFNNLFEPSASGAWGLVEGINDFAAVAGPTNYKWYGHKDWRDSISASSESSSNHVQSDASSPWSDGYILHEKGFLWGAVVSFSGFPTTGTAAFATLRDGAGGKVIWSIPLYGNKNKMVRLRFPIEFEHGMYLEGISGVSGDEQVNVNFWFDER